jgi:transcriptional regulator with XRE-family HTH domain
LPTNIGRIGGTPVRSVVSLAQEPESVSQTPDVDRRRLRVALRQAREAAGFTQNQAATALDWSISKIIRIEAGVSGITPVDIHALLTLYGQHDKKQEAELVELARSSQQSRADYRDVFSGAEALFGSTDLLAGAERQAPNCGSAE